MLTGASAGCAMPDRLGVSIPPGRRQTGLALSWGRLPAYPSAPAGWQPTPRLAGFSSAWRSWRIRSLSGWPFDILHGVIMDAAVAAYPIDRHDIGVVQIAHEVGNAL